MEKINKTGWCGQTGYRAFYWDGLFQFALIRSFLSLSLSVYRTALECLKWGSMNASQIFSHHPLLSSRLTRHYTTRAVVTASLNNEHNLTMNTALKFNTNKTATPPPQSQHHPSRASRLTTQDVDSGFLLRIACISLNYYQHQSTVGLQQMNRATKGSSYYLTHIVGPGIYRQFFVREWGWP